MKFTEKIWIPILAAALVLALAGCGRKNSSDSGDGKLRVMTSFYAMYDFAVKIGGEYAAVSNMVPAGTEPHDWEPAAADMEDLERADLFIYSGAGMEHWAEDVLESLSSQNLIVVEASDGIVLLSDGEQEEGEDGHDHGAYDPHVWLNPLNAKKEMENIKNAFVEADPSHADYYEKNYQTNAARLDALDEEFKTKLSGLPEKEIVVNHEAFGYLCSAYGLKQLGISGLSPDQEPDPGKMAEITDFVKEHGVKIIFSEELVNPKVAESVAGETGAAVEFLNPLEGLSEEELSDGADYFSVMEENLEKLVKALS
ncbi:MAG: metal ABC transporter substrate-binding protein [Eubacteriales bacterium]|nr:metal ABC transporter substrate-binding protein [Eubacteriales bacterium]